MSHSGFGVKLSMAPGNMKWFSANIADESANSSMTRFLLKYFTRDPVVFPSRHYNNCLTRATTSPGPEMAGMNQTFCSASFRRTSRSGAMRPNTIKTPS